MSQKYTKTGVLTVSINQPTSTAYYIARQGLNIIMHAIYSTRKTSIQLIQSKHRLSGVTNFIVLVDIDRLA
jgi:hypothetical protein